MDLIDDLTARGLIHDSTDLEFLRSRLDEKSIGVYVGFDPTADSLHVGHLMGQIGLRRFRGAAAPILALVLSPFLAALRPPFEHHVERDHEQHDAAGEAEGA